MWAREIWGGRRRGGRHLLALELLLRAEAREQRVQTFEVSRDLDLVVKIVFHPCPLMRRQGRGRGHCCGGEIMDSGVAVLISAFGLTSAIRDTAASGNMHSFPGRPRPLKHVQPG